MSWTMGTVRVAKDDRSELDAPGIPQVGYGEAESKAAMAAVREVVTLLVASDALGDGPFTVTANGHANPGGVPEGSWSPDYVSISIWSQAQAVE